MRIKANNLLLASYLIIEVASNSPSEPGGLGWLLSGLPVVGIIFAQDQNKILSGMDQKFSYSDGSTAYNPIHKDIEKYWNMYSWMYEDYEDN
jgi:hypothetical protein